MKAIFQLIKIMLLVQISSLTQLLHGVLTIESDSKVNLSAGTIQLHYSVDQLQESQLTLSPTATAINHVRIVLSDSSPNGIRSDSGTNVLVDKDNNFYWSFQTEPQKTSKDLFFQADFNLLIQQNSDFSGAISLQSLAKTAADGTQYINISVYFYGFNGSTYMLSANKENYQLPVVQAKPDAAPEGIKVLGIHKGISVQWTGNKSVSYSKSGISAVPDQVLVMLFNPGENNLDIKATRCLGPSSSTEAGVRGSCLTTKEATCTYSVDTETNECIKCLSDDNAEAQDHYTFVDSTQSNIEGRSGSFRTVLNTTDAPKTSFTNLQADKTYYVALAYNEGLQRTQCFPITPITTLSLTEVNGEPEGEPGDPRCFIVSASFGSAFAKHVDIFRWFRDRYLLKHDIGRYFMESYYLYSEPIADYIRARPVLQMLVRTLLWPVAYFLYACRDLGFLVPGALLLIVLGLVSYRRRSVRFAKKTQLR